MTENAFITDAVRFFDWCRFSLNHYAERLDAADREEFESGKMPQELLTIVSAAWSTQLKSHLPWDEHFAAVRRALPNPQDYDKFMNCPMEQEQNLPKPRDLQ